MTKKQSKINAKNNEVFAKLSKPEKRVMIAKDVLKMLKEERITATSGVCCQVKQSGIFQKEITKLTDEDGNGLIELSKPFKHVDCRVCAIGALFVSGLNVFNQFEVDANEIEDDDYSHEKYRTNFDINDDAFCDVIDRYFSEEQLQLIEVFFEGNNGLYKNYNYDDVAISFKNNHKPEIRMILIMQNIIANKGTFVPEKL